MTDCTVACLNQGVEVITPLITNGLMALGGGGLIGFVSAYALKKIAKIGLFILGAFVLGLMYLHHRQIVEVEWQQTEAAMRAGIQEAVTKTGEVISSTAQDFNHGNGFFGSEMLGGAVLGFTGGFVIGWKKG